MYTSMVWLNYHRRKWEHNRKTKNTKVNYRNELWLHAGTISSVYANISINEYKYQRRKSTTRKQKNTCTSTKFRWHDVFGEGEINPYIYNDSQNGPSCLSSRVGNYWQDKSGRNDRNHRCVCRLYQWEKQTKRSWIDIRTIIISQWGRSYWSLDYGKWR